MKTTLSSRRNQYLVRVSIFLIMLALIVGSGGFHGVGGADTPPSQNLEIRTWYDLDAIRNNLAGNHTLMNDLDSTTLGYEELAGPTANGGKGWQPIGCFRTAVAPGLGCAPGGGVAPWWDFLTGTFDGQGYEIRNLFINRPDEYNVGLFGGVLGVIKNIGVVNATVTGKQIVGGLVGGNGGNVSNSYSTGNMTGNAYVGGLVGDNLHYYDNGKGGIVSNSYSTSSVTGNNSVGGLVGANDELSTVSNSYATGNVTGTIQVGGLVGINSGTVGNSYSTGSVTGDSSVGGLVGENSIAFVSNSFWDTQTSGQATSDGGTGKNTTEMQYIATFSGASWNIIAVANPGTRNPSYIWNIVDNVTYPFLSWQPV
jgi:hypothetical protein